MRGNGRRRRVGSVGSLSTVVYSLLIPENQEAHICEGVFTDGMARVSFGLRAQVGTISVCWDSPPHGM